MSDRAADAGVFSPRLMAVVLAVAVMSFAAVITLVAWSPDLAKKDFAGAHPYSRSSIGYGGLVQLLKARGEAVSISQVQRRIEDRPRGLMVLTLRSYGVGEALNTQEIQPPALIVLPKWRGSADPARPEWEAEIQLIEAEVAARALVPFDAESGVKRVDPAASLSTPFGAFAPTFAEHMQVIRSNSLQTVVPAGGGALLAKRSDASIYILSDPDLLNTSGLAAFENARFATALMDWARRGGDEPIIFDATLHGFERSDSLLKFALDAPFLGATLTGLAAAALLGWAALVRFGAPAREDRAIALGKAALVDSTAGLVTMTGRARRMAPGYLALTRRIAAERLGAPKHISERDLTRFLDRAARNAGREAWSAVASALGPAARTNEDLLAAAQAAYRWREEMTHGD